MPVEITCRNVEIEPQLREIVVKKSLRLKRFFEKVDRIEVVFHNEKHEHCCEINVFAGHIHSHSHAKNGNEGSAFDKALRAAERQIKESKNRMIDKKRHGVSTAEAIVRAEAELEVEEVEAV